MKQITIIRIRRGPQQELNEELHWFGTSLGLFGERDKDKSCFRIFLTLLKTRGARETLTSDKLAQGLQLTRGTVVHHLHRLMDMGLVVHEREGYALREQRLDLLVEGLRKDADNTFKELEDAAKELEKKLKMMMER